MYPLWGWCLRVDDPARPWVFSLESGLIISEGDSTYYSIVLAITELDWIFLHDLGANDKFHTENIQKKIPGGGYLFPFWRFSSDEAHVCGWRRWVCETYVEGQYGGSYNLPVSGLNAGRALPEGEVSRKQWIWRKRILLWQNSTSTGAPEWYW